MGGGKRDLWEIGGNILIFLFERGKEGERKMWGLRFII